MNNFLCIKVAIGGLSVLALLGSPSSAQQTASAQQIAPNMATLAKAAPAPVKIVPTGGTGWAKSSVNAAIFRTNSLVTFGDTQTIAFYDGEGNVMLGQRKVGAAAWKLQKTRFKGQAQDAHNVISLGIDGRGVLHMVWDLHNQKLRYVRSVAPGSLELTDEVPMTGQNEVRVTYPQFYHLPDGDLLFLFRDGSSGNGNAMLNRYDVQTDKWQAVQHPLVAGGGQRNAYLNNLAVDSKGGIHLSWVWRDSPDVATNHDVCYAFSPDEGRTWQKSSGEKLQMPITIENAEVAWTVPRNSELINQTSMTIDSSDRPVVATYWRPAGTEVPQYQLVWHDGTKWQQREVGARTQGFRLSGGGTKRIPISRPLVVAGKTGEIYVIYRDEERSNGVTVAASRDAARTKWDVKDITTEKLGSWEPTYDPTLWKRDGVLHLLVQRVGQGDGETLEQVVPQEVAVLEWKPGP